MRSRVVAVFGLVLLSALQVTPQEPTEPPLSNEQVVRLLRAGLSEEVIVGKIQQAATVSFRLDVDALLELKEAGASDRVIAAMLARHTASAAGAATAGEVAEPEYLGIVLALDGETGEFGELERQSFIVKSRVKNPFNQATERTMELKGARSPVRFRRDNLPSFVVRVESQEQDPTTVAHLLRLQVVAGKRQLVMSRSNPRSSQQMDPTTYRMALAAEPYGRSSVKISPQVDLPPGEYAFATQHRDLFCFGVDRSDPG